MLCVTQESARRIIFLCYNRCIHKKFSLSRTNFDEHSLLFYNTIKFIIKVTIKLPCFFCARVQDTEESCIELRDEAEHSTIDDLDQVRHDFGCAESIAA